MVRDEFSLAALTQPSFLTPCVMGMPTVSVPIGDPQSNRKPRLSTSATWRKNLKDLASRVTFFTKEIASTTNEVGVEQRMETRKKAFVSSSNAQQLAWERKDPHNHEGDSEGQRNTKSHLVEKSRKCPQEYPLKQRFLT
ncbi:similar to spatial-delta (predicted), isoform CRA_c [Rattus norvegicus]|uniref:Similar to spatial-delta (Predicted), isoform CRA_c n=1 Tax=Rattus norvegicus TaxID=10116 RepID=A6K3Z1_RAT|nr:similar to spatial-delta (predicted), isoform CRA_c [Rattus norvegicus]EDL93034.1 similar to spatial-delta (predicted), isoform CRA_c [Rattus norvegicus]